MTPPLDLKMFDQTVYWKLSGVVFDKMTKE